MKVIFNTKSNFKNCNNQPLEVVEISGVRITAKIPRYGFNIKGQPVGNFDTNCDFTIDEIKQFEMNTYKNS